MNGVIGDPLTWAGPYFGAGSAASALAALEGCEAMLMGRGTYEIFSKQWPAASGPYADRINAIRKYVFSSTLASTPTWTNTVVVSGDVVAEVTALKARAGADLTFYGHGRFGQTLTDAGLVDALTLTVVPVFVPGGTTVLPSRRIGTGLAAHRRRPGSRSRPGRADLRAGWRTRWSAVMIVEREVAMVPAAADRDEFRDEFGDATERFRAELTAHCYRMLGSLHDAQDVVQETYLRAWRGWAGFEGRASTRAWLYRIATNASLSALRHSSRRFVPSGLGAPSDDPDARTPARRGRRLARPLSRTRPAPPARTRRRSPSLDTASGSPSSPACSTCRRGSGRCSSCATSWSSRPPRSARCSR